MKHAGSTVYPGLLFDALGLAYDAERVRYFNLLDELF